MNSENVVGHVFNSTRVQSEVTRLPESDVVLSENVEAELSYNVVQWIRAREDVDGSLESLVDSLRRRGRFWLHHDYIPEVLLSAPSEDADSFGGVNVQYLDSEAIHAVGMVDERSRARVTFMETSFTRFSFDTSVEK